MDISEVQLQILRLLQVMFNAAPGEEILLEFTESIENSESTIESLAQALSESPLMDAIYPQALNDDEFAESFLNNLTAGLLDSSEFEWALETISDFLDAGSTRAEVILLAMNALADMEESESSWGAVAKQLNNKVEVSAYYSIDKAGNSDSLSDLQRVTAEVTYDDESVASQKAILDDGVSGTVVDGYISGATVFIDHDRNGEPSLGEVVASTDAQGKFNLPSGIMSFGPIVITGGIDISTGEPFDGRMSAPAGSTVVSPVTSIIDRLTEDNSITVQSAIELVSTAFAIEEVDLLNFDAINAITDPASDSGMEQTALRFQSAAVQINTSVNQIAALLEGVGVTSDEAGGIDIAYSAIASVLAEASANGSQPILNSDFRLGEKETVQSVLASAVEISLANAEESRALEAISDDASEAIANLNGAIGDTLEGEGSAEDAIVAMTSVQVVAETIETTMKAGALSGNAGNAKNRTEGDTLKILIASVDVDLDDIKGDSQSATSSGGGGGGGGSSRPSVPATPVLTVEQALTTSASIYDISDSLANVVAEATNEKVAGARSIVTTGDASMTVAVANVLSGYNLSNDGSTVTILDGGALEAIPTVGQYNLSDSGNSISLAVEQRIIGGAGEDTITLISDRNYDFITNHDGLNNVEKLIAPGLLTDGRTITLGASGASVMNFTSVSGNPEAETILELRGAENILSTDISDIEILKFNATLAITDDQHNEINSIIGVGDDNLLGVFGNGAILAFPTVERYELRGILELVLGEPDGDLQISGHRIFDGTVNIGGTTLTNKISFINIHTLTATDGADITKNNAGGELDINELDLTADQSITITMTAAQHEGITGGWDSDPPISASDHDDTIVLVDSGEITADRDVGTYSIVEGSVFNIHSGTDGSLNLIETGNLGTITTINSPDSSLLYTYVGSWSGFDADDVLNVWRANISAVTGLENGITINFTSDHLGHLELTTEQYNSSSISGLDVYSQSITISDSGSVTAIDGIDHYHLRGESTLELDNVGTTPTVFTNTGSGNQIIMVGSKTLDNEIRLYDGTDTIVALDGADLSAMGDRASVEVLDISSVDSISVTMTVGQYNNLETILSDSNDDTIILSSHTGPIGQLNLFPGISTYILHAGFNQINLASDDQSIDATSMADADELKLSGIYDVVVYLDEADLDASSASGVVNVQSGDTITSSGINIIQTGSGDDIISAGVGDDDITGGSGADTIIFEDSAATNGADILNDFLSSTDKLDLSAFDTAGALVDVNGALTSTDGTIYLLSNSSAGDADSASAVATALSAAADWTDADSTSWLLISDDDSAAIYEWANTAASADEVTESELTLVAIINGVVAASDVLL